MHSRRGTRKGSESGDGGCGKDKGVVKGKKLFGGESIGYMNICLGWMYYWLPVWEEVGGM